MSLYHEIMALKNVPLLEEAYKSVFFTFLINMSKSGWGVVLLELN